MQLSCAGDLQNRVFLAQELGYWPNVDDYYTSGRKVLQIDKLEGTQAELEQLLRILLTAA